MSSIKRFRLHSIVQQLQTQLNQSQQQISKLEKELEQWKNSSKEANQRALTLQEKLHTMANAVRGNNVTFIPRLRAAFPFS